MLPLAFAVLLKAMVSPNAATISEAADAARMDDMAGNLVFMDNVRLRNDDFISETTAEKKAQPHAYPSRSTTS